MASQSNFYAFDGIFFDNVKATIAYIMDLSGNPIAFDSNGDGIADDPATLDAAWSAGVYAEIAAFRQALPNAYTAGHVDDIPPAPAQLSLFNGDSLAFPAVSVAPRELRCVQTHCWIPGIHGSRRDESLVIAMRYPSSPPNQIAQPWLRFPAGRALLHSRPPGSLARRSIQICGSDWLPL